jgi:hypothetical protein
MIVTCPCCGQTKLRVERGEDAAGYRCLRWREGGREPDRPAEAYSTPPETSREMPAADQSAGGEPVTGGWPTLTTDRVQSRVSPSKSGDAIFEECGQPFWAFGTRGPRPRLCSAACRKRRERARKRGAA